MTQIGQPESLGVSIGLMVYAVNFTTGILGGVLYTLFGLNKAVREETLGVELPPP
jgi:hypothetical protein